MFRHFMTRRLAAVLALTVFISGAALGAEAPSAMPLEQFERLHAMIKPQAGESRWMEIDWHPSVWEGRQKAAREGKPLFVWAGSGGAPAAGC